MFHSVGGLHNVNFATCPSAKQLGENREKAVQIAAFQNFQAFKDTEGLVGVPNYSNATLKLPP